MRIDLNQNMTARSTKVGLSTLPTPSDSAPPVMTLDQLHFCSVGWRSNILKQSTIRVILICSSISCTGGRHRPTYSLIETGDLPLPLSYSIQWEWFVWSPWSLQSVWSSWPGWPGQPWLVWPFSIIFHLHNLQLSLLHLGRIFSLVFNLMMEWLVLDLRRHW